MVRENLWTRMSSSTLPCHTESELHALYNQCVRDTVPISCVKQELSVLNHLSEEEGKKKIIVKRGGIPSLYLFLYFYEWAF